MRNLNLNRILFLFCIAVTVQMFTACSKNDDTLVAPNKSEVLKPDPNEKGWGYVDQYWSNNSFLTNFIIDEDQTNFIYYINQNVADVWGIPAVPLSIVVDNVNPTSTFNAISYGSKKIYFGEYIYQVGLSRGQIVPAFILAHEFGHQLQYTFGLPSVQENTVRSGELEADGFSGYYMRSPNGYNASWEEAGPGFEFAAEIGDNNINDPNHHGTMPQRRSATRLGWYLGEYDLSANDFDFNFFYYYQYVLNGQFKMTKPARISDELNTFMMSKIEELKKINSGEIDKTEFEHLRN
jgi:uncharacterized protein